MNSTGRKWLVGLTTFSLGLNAVLFARVAWPSRSPNSPDPGHREPTATVPSSRPDAGAAPRPRSPAPQSPDFRWGSVHSADFRQYAANLRALGCPEKTLADILWPEIYGHYTERMNQLTRPLSATYWEHLTRTKERRAEREAYQALREGMEKDTQALEQEYLALIEDLFGGSDSRSRERAEGSAADPHWAFLSETNRSLIQAQRKAYAERERELRQQGLAEEEVNRHLQQLAEAQAAERRDSLTPEEQEEYLMRGSRVSWYYERLVAFEPTPEEHRAILRLREAAGEYPSTERQKKLDAELQQTLGENRFAEYQRANDDHFHDLYEVATRFDLPTTTAEQAFSIWQEVAARAKTAQASEDSSRREINSTLRAIQADATARISNLFGAEGFEAYQHHGGWRLRDLSKPTE